MAQGSKKLSGKKTKTAGHKVAKVKKGGRVIAPKKASVIEAQKTYKTLEKAIKNNIEQEIAGRAKANSQNLKIVNIATPASEEPGKKSKKKHPKAKGTGQIIRDTMKKLSA